MADNETTAPETAQETPKRGRGRPREISQGEIKQVVFKLPLDLWQDFVELSESKGHRSPSSLLREVIEEAVSRSR